MNEIGSAVMGNLFFVRLLVFLIGPSTEIRFIFQLGYISPSSGLDRQDHCDMGAKTGGSASPFKSVTFYRRYWKGTRAPQHQQDIPYSLLGCQKINKTNKPTGLQDGGSSGLSARFQCQDPSLKITMKPRPKAISNFQQNLFSALGLTIHVVL